MIAVTNSMAEGTMSYFQDQSLKARQFLSGPLRLHALREAS